jgi:hypothetical protein
MVLAFLLVAQDVAGVGLEDRPDFRPYAEFE